jgi:hypothetical protein
MPPELVASDHPVSQQDIFENGSIAPIAGIVLHVVWPMVSKHEQVRRFHIVPVPSVSVDHGIPVSVEG